MSTTSDQVNDGIYTIRIPRDKLTRLHEIAESEHRTLAGKIRAWVDWEIQVHDGAGTSAPAAHASETEVGQ